MQKTIVTILLATTALAMLANCAAGPDFEKPAVPDVARYTETDLPQKTAAANGIAGAAQSFAPDQAATAQWWKLFGSEPLNQLMAQALKNNPDLKAASAALRQASEKYEAATGDRFPSVDASFGATRQKFNPAATGQVGVPSSIFTLHNASVKVSYGLDIFGGTQRAIEKAEAETEYQRFERDATYMTLTANVVTAAVQEASLNAQVQKTQKIIAIETEQLAVIKKQFELGAVDKSSLLQQQATLAQTQAALPTLQKQLAVQRSQLAVLVGVFPGNSVIEPFDLATLHLPEILPVSVPSKLVAQRPDIRAAEAQLHAASAGIGVATADMLPKFSITGNYGSETTDFGKLFSPSAELWSVGTGVLQPIFRGGELLHQKRSAVAAYDKAAAQYESTVLAAFKNVGDTLRALQYDADALASQADAAKAAEDSMAMTQAQFKAGAIAYPHLLDAQRTYQQAHISLVQAQAARFSDTAALFQALGGSMEESPEVSAEQPPTDQPTPPSSETSSWPHLL